MTRPDHGDEGAVAPQVTYFAIGQQNGTVYNVVGNVYVGDTPDTARKIARHLRDGVRDAGLEGPVAGRARAEVDDIDAALGAERPDRHRIAGSLARLTGLLSATGTLVAAGAALIDPMTGLALWLGELGKAVLTELPKS